MSTRLTNIRKERLKKLEQIRKLGINPYPSISNRKHSIEEARKMMGEGVVVAGRIRSLRSHGKISFADLEDESAKIQLFFTEEDLGEKKYDFLKLLDVGDFLEAEGKVIETKAGEISIKPTELTLLTKSIRPLPDKWHGLKDIEARYRRRYLDLLVNPNAKKILDYRWRIEKEMRQFLWKEGFVEVETPVLQALYGGTNAKPFITHMNALDSDFYLRIAPELYLKRLVVGGYEKIFEIARNFRNEGINTTHQPEFTMIEWYEAYADYHKIMDTTEALTKHLVKKLYGATTIRVKGKSIDISGRWSRVAMTDLIQEHLGISADSVNDKELKEILTKNNIKIPGLYSRGKALFLIFEHLITGKLIQPTWVIDYPIEVCPLQKRHKKKEGYTERFEGYIGGVEYADGWSEITSGIEQRTRFEVEQKHLREGDMEAHPFDKDFIESLEYGMPPLGGIGIGIDRLVMFLTDNWSIRDVIAFPTLRPKKDRG